MSLVTKNSASREEVDLFLPWCLRSHLGAHATPTLLS